MDILFAGNIVKWVHLASMVFAMGAAAGCSLVAASAVRAAGEGGAALWRFYDLLNIIAFVAFAVLLVSGPLPFWVKYDFAFFTTAFWIKMALIVALIVAVVVEDRATKKVRAGDTTAVGPMERSGYAIRAIDLSVILAAVFAFN
jgi:hypothetical protein